MNRRWRRRFGPICGRRWQSVVIVDFVVGARQETGVDQESYGLAQKGRAFQAPVFQHVSRQHAKPLGHGGVKAHGDLFGSKMGAVTSQGASHGQSMDDCQKQAQTFFSKTVFACKRD